MSLKDSEIKPPEFKSKREMEAWLLKHPDRYAELQAMKELVIIRAEKAALEKENRRMAKQLATRIKMSTADIPLKILMDENGILKQQKEYAKTQIDDLQSQVAKFNHLYDGSTIETQCKVIEDLKKENQELKKVIMSALDHTTVGKSAWHILHEIQMKYPLEEGQEGKEPFVPEGQKPRDSVIKFAYAMEAVLRQNDYKGGWSRCTPERLIKKLHEEEEELENTFNETMELSSPVWNYTKETRKEAVDVANLCMMIWANSSVENPSEGSKEGS